MADQTLAERLQPSLLDRLTDNEPGSVKEGRHDRVIDIRRLREIVQRDLSWLLNTTNNSKIDRDTFPNAAASVLNYGVREVAGDFSNMDRAELIRASIDRSVRQFEPRLDTGTLDVILRAEERDNQTVLTYDIRGEMWAQPLPMELYLRSEVDVTTGAIELERKA